MSAAAVGVDPVPTHEFAYDALGRIVRAENPSGVVERQYDSVGRLIEETALGSSVRFVHDDVAHTTDLIFPDGRRESTKLDIGGRPIDVTLVTPGGLGGVTGTTLVSVKYAGVLRPTRFMNANGVQTTLVYDDAVRLIRVDLTRGGALIDSARTRYDERSRRAVIQLLGAPMRSKLHDARDRLRNARWGFTLAPLPDEHLPAAQTSAIAAVAAATAGATPSESYQLDAADSRLQHVITASGSVVNSYTSAPGHRITTVGGQLIAYHKDGHRASDTQFHYDVDALGRVVRVSFAIKSRSGSDAFSSGSGIKCKNILQRNRGICI